MSCVFEPKSEKIAAEIVAPARNEDVSKVNALGWSSTIDLKDGLTETYEWYVQNLGTN